MFFPCGAHTSHACVPGPNQGQLQHPQQRYDQRKPPSGSSARDRLGATTQYAVTVAALHNAPSVVARQPQLHHRKQLQKLSVNAGKPIRIDFGSCCQLALLLWS
eukprot:3452125-Amphidinium_carterae.1